MENGVGPNSLRQWDAIEESDIRSLILSELLAKYQQNYRLLSCLSHWQEASVFATV